MIVEDASNLFPDDNYLMRVSRDDLRLLIGLLGIVAQDGAIEITGEARETCQALALCLARQVRTKADS